jgi:hypothetical protein
MSVATAQRIPIYIVIFITLFYSYNIFVSNLIIFSFILIIHCIELKIYKSGLATYINNPTTSTNSSEKMSLLDIVREYSCLKGINDQSISDLNNMFSSITLIGGVAIYFLILLYQPYSAARYVDIVIYAIAEVVYFCVIYYLRYNVQCIVVLGTSLKFMSKYLVKVPFSDLEIETKDDSAKVDIELLNHKIKNIKDLTIKTNIRVNEIINSQEWILLNIKFNEEWEQFELFGFSINDTTILKKIFAVVCGYFFVSQARLYWFFNNGGYI